MKIDDRISTYMALLHSAAVKSESQPVGKSAPAPQVVVETPPAAVELSSTAVQLADDEARRERLNIIRQQLAEGSYNISGKDVADKILNVLKG